MLKSITVEVIGSQQLYCEGCQERVERLVAAVEGVRRVRASARTQRVEVLLDTAVVEATAIAKRLAEAGYETRVRG